MIDRIQLVYGDFIPIILIYGEMLARNNTKSTFN